MRRFVARANRGAVMLPALRDEALAEAVRIGTILLESRKEAPGGILWDPAVLSGFRASFPYDQTIYSGTPGIALFMVELFRQTNDSQWLDIARAAADACEGAWHGRFAPAFLTGSLGLSELSIRLWELTGEQMDLDRAVETAAACNPANAPKKACEYINGAAGLIPQFAWLYSISSDERLLKNASHCVDSIVRSVEAARIGAFWDRDPERIRGVCGLSHGAAGVGLSLYETAAYADSDGLRWLAEQAFRYDETQYDPAWRNWPNFMRLFRREGRQDLVQQYEAGDLTELTTGIDMDAWCHGATGEGLARLRAFELSRSEVHRAFALMAMARAESTIVRSRTVRMSYNLCHGLGGQAELFLAAARVLGIEGAVDRAWMLVAAALDDRDENAGQYIGGLQTAVNGHDPSLLTGTASIGYFLLRVRAPELTPSILMPRLCRAPGAIPQLGRSRSDVRAAFLASAYPGTVRQLEEKCPDLWTDFLERESTVLGGDVEEFTDFCRRSPILDSPELRQAFARDAALLSLDQSVPSYALLEAMRRSQVARRDALRNAPSDEKLRARVRLSPYTRLEENGTNATVLVATPLRPRSFDLDEFSAAVIRTFRDARTIRDAVALLAEDLEVSPEERDALEDAVILQVLNAADADILFIEG